MTKPHPLAPQPTGAPANYRGPMDLPVVTLESAPDRDAAPCLGTPPRSKADVAHDIRVDCCLGKLTRAEADEKLQRLGAVDDPVAWKTAEICAQTRKAKQAGTFRTAPESRYFSRALAGKLGR